jgi:hypothetical protein
LRKNRFHRIPLWVKLLYTVFLLVLIRIYWMTYPLANFLWFSDIALIVTGVALWLENSTLASMMALAILVPEIGWTVALLSRLITGAHLGGVTGYMFDPGIPKAVRALSLFHPFLPMVVLWTIYRLGYDRRAWFLQTGFGWMVLLITFCSTRPSENINCVFGPGGSAQHFMPPILYFAIVMVAVPLLIYLPTHWVLLRLFSHSDVVSRTI